MQSCPFISGQYNIGGILSSARAPQVCKPRLCLQCEGNRIGPGTVWCWGRQLCHLFCRTRPPSGFKFGKLYTVLVCQVCSLCVCDLAHSLGLDKRGDAFFVTGHSSLVSVLQIANTVLKQTLYRYTLPLDRNWWTCFASYWINPQAPCVMYIGQAFRYSSENAFYIFNQQIYFIVWYLLDRASLI